MEGQLPGWHTPMPLGANPEDYKDLFGITEEQFKAIAFRCPKNAPSIFVPHINKWAATYGMDSMEVMKAFLPQLVHESGHFRYSKEIWGPTPQQKRYERDFKEQWGKDLPDGHRNKLAYELGNSQPGDGKWFMGRGAIMTTGRANYATVSKHLFNSDWLIKNPEVLESPEYSIRAAMFYFSTRVMGKVQDLQDVTSVTKKINGGYNGLQERKDIYEIASDLLV